MEILDQRRRREAGGPLQGGEAHRAFLEELGENRPLPADSQRGDQSLVFHRERARGKPSREAATAVRSHEVVFLEVLQMVSHGPEGEAESPWKLPEMQSGLCRDQ